MKVSKDKYGQVRVTIPQRLCDILDLVGGEEINFEYVRKCPHYEEGKCTVDGLLKIFEVVVKK